jgi:hypothetical protein
VAASGTPSSRTTTRGVFTSPDSMASLRLKSLTTQAKSASSLLSRPDGAKGVAEKSYAARMPRLRWMRSSPPIQRVASSMSARATPRIFDPAGTRHAWCASSLMARMPEAEASSPSTAFT